MASLEATGPNAEQIQYWNETAGPKWVRAQQLLDAQIAPLGRRAMDQAAIHAGERVFDVGCGCGQTTLEIAGRVGPTGSVTGIDISTVMLERARAMAAEAEARHVRFENADVQTHAFASGDIDVVFSRFGVMFFSNPDAAFANLRRALRPEGRLAFVCWQAVHQNPWMFVPLAAALQHISLPAPPAPDAPGPFAFADPERVRGILSRAGFDDIAFDGVNETLTIGAGLDLDGVVEFLLSIGPTGNALRDAAGDQRLQVAAAVRDALVPYHTADGARMESAAWIVSARRRE